ncbi:HNH endonuclease [Crocosphaera sp.]|uniref:HNH endonuclease n=1 Tax=Crocosphaera sp. TaxID=2729996 RepID=UPI003F285058|nr:hypothetical protein [Crocosphaera sp.]
MVINNFIRLKVRKRAKYLCEYCHSPERSNATPFPIDHIIPQSLDCFSSDVQPTVNISIN